MISFEGKKGVGIDIVEVGRFTPLVGDKDNSFLKKVFSDEERRYAFSYKDSAIHFAGMFAAKEAVSKACGVYAYPVPEIEIRHTKEGKPCVFFKGEEMDVALSLSHTASIATAIAMLY